MKYIAILAILLGAAAAPAAAGYDEEGLSEAVISSDTAKLEEGEEDEDQPLIQENDEDISAFVLDYIRRDVQLKGCFLFEDKAAGKVLKLDLVSVDKKAKDAEGGTRTVSAVFREGAKKRSVVFHLHSGAWGGLDIFRIELLPQGGAAGAQKK